MTPFSRRSSSITNKSQLRNGYLFSLSSFSMGCLLKRHAAFLIPSWVFHDSDYHSLKDRYHLFGGILRELHISLQFSFVLIQLSKTKRSPTAVGFRDLHVMCLSSQLLKSSELAHLQDVKQVLHHALGTHFHSKSFKQSIFALQAKRSLTVDVVQM